MLLLGAMWTNMKAITSSEMNTHRHGPYILSHLQKTIKDSKVKKWKEVQQEAPQ